jgi:hypothetical protein
MLKFGNDLLTASVIDPQTDHEFLGNRYCWGGYLFQLKDRTGQDLLSGPKYPAKPARTGGQGAPEVFCHGNWTTGETFNVENGRGLIIGIGTYRKAPNEPLQLETPCQWTSEVWECGCRMQTEQSLLGWHYHLTRTLEISERTVKSSTRIVGNGERPLRVLWYTHPFFPLVNGGMKLHLNLPLQIEENPGFEQNGHEIRMREDFDWQNHGHLEWFKGDLQRPLEATFDHPVTGTVTMRCDLPTMMMPLWANGCTISLEPYVQHDLAKGDERSWSVSYEFKNCS